MSRSTRLLIVAGIRLPAKRLNASDGHTTTVRSVTSECPNGHACKTPFCPTCGGAASPVTRDRMVPLPMRERVLALGVAADDEDNERGVLWSIGDYDGADVVIGVPIPIGGDYDIRTASVDGATLADAFQRATSLCAAADVRGDIAIHVAAWSY